MRVLFLALATMSSAQQVVLPPPALVGYGGVPNATKCGNAFADSRFNELGTNVGECNIHVPTGDNGQKHKDAMAFFWNSRLSR